MTWRLRKNREKWDDPQMAIVDARWTPQVNILIIRCNKCQRIIEHRADRWTVHCPRPCSNYANISALRWWYMQNKVMQWGH